MTLCVEGWGVGALCVYVGWGSAFCLRVWGGGGGGGDSMCLCVCVCVCVCARARARACVCVCAYIYCCTIGGVSVPGIYLQTR